MDLLWHKAMMRFSYGMVQFEKKHYCIFHLAFNIGSETGWQFPASPRSHFLKIVKSLAADQSERTIPFISFKVSRLANTRKGVFSTLWQI